MSLEIHRSYSTNDTLVGFQQQPDGRGTLTILFSCLLTLSLCVWSATHLDLPRLRESKWQYTFKYLKWSLVGLFAPELIIWVAWRQRISAHVLHRFVQQVASSNGTATHYPEWTTVHGFYAGMGGFVFDLTEPDLTDDGPLIPDLQRLHVTPRGLQLLARCGLLPSISAEDIMDKSKTDGTGKLICCAQVIWVVISAVSRLAVGLPVTPLEINTIAHVVCALTVYVLWWHKPRWVNEPTFLRGKWVRPLCAFMYMSSLVSAKRRHERDLLRNFGVKTELAGVLYSPGDGEYHASLARGAKSTVVLGSGLVDSNSTNEATSFTGKIIPRPERGVLDTANLDPEHVAAEAMRQIRWKNCSEAIHLYPAIRQRMKHPERNGDELRFREALQLYPEMPQNIQSRFAGQCKGQEGGKLAGNPLPGWVFMSEELVVDHPRNWPGDDLIRHMQGHLMGMIMWFTSTLYGAIHLAGWNERFPTNIELWFWRGSALYVVFSGLLWSLLNLLGHTSGPVWVYWYDFLANDVRRKSHYVIYGLAVIGGSLFFVARTYLVAEAFISLRALPASAYASPSWILTVPHIG
ncbi:hypothetical protein HII31_05697 [Pseudocercospora fuligena]|uniref:Uncharacterized protein n=1 Tax=Pseudocercospora fuligena TaxID=685502 RepID=A0A8H6RMS3_9PEZI|nr:hypothetical protein HII31_05697 [Pseudocercospora fuligena]